ARLPVQPPPPPRPRNTRDWQPTTSNPQIMTTSSNPPDPDAPKPGGLQSMLARLRGMVSAQQTPEEPASEEELLPTFDVPLPEPPAAEPPPPPVALPPHPAPPPDAPPLA